MQVDFQARLKRHEAEDTLKLKTDLEARTRERDNLQATVKTMTEQSKDYVRDCKVSDFYQVLRPGRFLMAPLISGEDHGTGSESGRRAAPNGSFTISAAMDRRAIASG